MCFINPTARYTRKKAHRTPLILALAVTQALGIYARVLIQTQMAMLVAALQK